MIATDYASWMIGKDPDVVGAVVTLRVWCLRCYLKISFSKVGYFSKRVPLSVSQEAS